MGAIALTSCTVSRVIPELNYRSIVIETPTTANSADTIAVDMSVYGASTLLAIRGTVHTTENSVLVGEAPTTSVSGVTATITIGGSSVTNKKRVFELLMK